MGESIADRVKKRRRDNTSTGGRKLRGGAVCSEFRKNLIKLIIIAWLLGSSPSLSSTVSNIFNSFSTKAIGLLSDDMKASIGALSDAATSYISVYIRATIDSLRISIQTNNSSMWETFLKSLSWTNFGKVTAGITAARTLVGPAVSNTCSVTNDTLNRLVDGICSELEEKLRTKTAELGTQTDLSIAQKEDAEKQGEEQANNTITNYFTRSCANGGGRKSRR